MKTICVGNKIPVATSSICDEMLVEWRNEHNNRKYTETRKKTKVWQIKNTAKNHIKKRVHK